MKNKQIKCPTCGNTDVTLKMKKCPVCNVKLPKPIYTKWWFWTIIVLGVLIIAAIGSGGEDATLENGGTDSGAGTAESQENKYEKVDIDKMLEDLKQNALKAEKDYQNKYVELTGKISSFDSDGKYITIESVTASEWNFDTVMCYIKDDGQREYLMNKTKGDTITVRGKITSIGEVLGYSLRMEEVK